MKKSLLAIVLLFAITAAFSQGGKKPAANQKPPSQAEIDKMMEDATQGMSPEEKAEMKKMMGGMVEGMTNKPALAEPFTDNKKLVPSKDISRIKSIPSKAFTDADVIANTTQLYNKLMAKISPAEKAIVNKVQAAAKNGNSLMSASVTCLLQGHNLAAMALAMKAVQADIKNVNNQNNLAAILSQSGYPEKAIPYLQKLSKQLPGNSTVLHNLGYAWLSLGEIDTASRYFAYAATRNPNNPETSLCRGVIAEIKGDPQKAADNYVASFEEAPNPFAESMAKNVNAQKRLEKLDFEKLKKRIVIYEYFKKDWIKIPALSDGVTGFEKDMRTKNGYAEMFDTLKNRIDLMIEASNAEIEALAEKGQAEFVATMAKETQKGISMMSMPAVYVQKMLAAHVARWTEKYTREHQALIDALNAKKAVMTKAGKNDKCPDFDRKNNEFMAYANPKLREFHARKIEEFRNWLNAFCTWTWYIAGNPKNVIMTQCISWTAAYVSFLEAAVSEQYSIAKSCVQQDGDKADAVTAPAVPNFTCPAVVTIPVGLDEIRLSAGSINFNDNSWDIAQAPGSMPQNMTTGYGVGNHVAEPGKNGTPYTKTGNGSIAASGMGGVDNDLTPLSKIPMDDLTPLSKIPMDELAPLDPALLDGNKKSRVKDATEMARAKYASKILKDMLSVKCPGELPKKNTRKSKFDKPGQDRFIVGVGELEVWNEEMKAWENAKGDFRFENGFQVGLGELELWNEELKGWENSKGEVRFESGLTVGMGELEVWNEEANAWENAKGEFRYESGLIVSMGKLEFEDVQTNGPQTSITNGLESSSTPKNFIKGLFQ